MKKKFVTVFGSSNPRPGDYEYEIAYQLGKKLAANGFNVCTGGFQGIMDAVSKGAFEEGAEALGITLEVYNAIPSKYLTREIKCKTLFERLQNLIKYGDAYIVLNGGTGTLVELAVVWELINKNLLNEKPFACHGSMWKEIVNLMEKQIKKENRKTGLIKCFDEIDDCANYIIEKLKE
ncbi:LOG family protein [Ignavibacteria bacterium 4148-Me]|uniref:LOG family protein n=1 Tax=Rosettibacter primus TaxID=3111523 RepID=UPI00336BBE99